MRKIGDPLTTEGKGSTNIQSRRGKSFGYQVLGFGSGGGPSPIFTIASGGDTTITDGDYKVHVFTGDGTLTVSQAGNAPDFPGNPLAGPNTSEYLVVAGGGSCRIGGGGGGGFRTSYPGTPLQVAITAQGYPITIGGANSDSVFSTITSAGGGYGGHYTGSAPTPADPGGSGGGAGFAGGSVRAGGTGNDPPTSPSQGNNGGNNAAVPAITGGGGGGGSAVGANSPGSNGGPGGAGAGIADAFFGPTAPSYGEPGPAGRYFSGGGGASGVSSGNTTTGGVGGGGNGGNAPASTATAGSTNMGGGGGGQINAPYGKPGGSGIVFIRYKFQ